MKMYGQMTPMSGEEQMMEINPKSPQINKMIEEQIKQIYKKGYSIVNPKQKSDHNGFKMMTKTMRRKT